MTWDERVIIKKSVRATVKKKDGQIVRHTSEGPEFAEIHEVYYDDDGTIMFYTPEPVTAFGETQEELMRSIGDQYRAFLKPALRYEDLPKEEDEIDSSSS